MVLSFDKKPQAIAYKQMLMIMEASINKLTRGNFLERRDNLGVILEPESKNISI